ncbi:uroporphyrinogen-III C-methyltransferase [Benzoatithermus flavus]|uniref:uroporphyrinogen-III C-methyltransferase n=1 Tax=Benzoatithermus flavus TaxID=3108223 RepID=A0ABU8XK76_9PROT
MTASASGAKGIVYLVGAGPGDPELITLKAARLLREAEVVVYDRLVGPGILELIGPSAERIYVGKERANHIMRQAEINALLVRRGLRGQRVVRLKGGDPLIFGRGGEEIEALAEAGVPFEVVPGVTAAAGCAAATAIPLTHRDHARTLVLVTGHTKDGEPELNWQALCQPGQTIVFYMGHKALDRLCARLIEHGLPGALPAALVENGTLPSQRAIRATLATIAAEVERATLQGPALLIVGEVVAFADLAHVAAAAGALHHAQELR